MRQEFCKAHLFPTLICIIAISLDLGVCHGYECNQKLYEAKGEAAVGSNGFALEITSLGAEKNASHVSGYVPGKHYLISLKGWRTQFFVQTFRGFGITATFKSGSTLNNKPAGRFEVKKAMDSLLYGY